MVVVMMMVVIGEGRRGGDDRGGSDQGVVPRVERPAGPAEVRVDPGLRVWVRRRARGRDRVQRVRGGAAAARARARVVSVGEEVPDVGLLALLLAPDGGVEGADAALQGFLLPGVERAHELAVGDVVLRELRVLLDGDPQLLQEVLVGLAVILVAPGFLFRLRIRLRRPTTDGPDFIEIILELDASERLHVEILEVRREILLR